MSEMRDGRVPAHMPADGESRAGNQFGLESLSTLGPPVDVSTVGENTVAGLREDAHRLAARCDELERLFAEGSMGLPNANGASSLPAAARDLRRACQHLLAALGGEIPSGSSIEATSRRVLVVDDRADAIDMVATLLEHAGFEVLTASNGLEGLLAAHRSRPTVILMDVQMPVLDGIEATRLLKAAAATRDIPVIAHTAGPHVPPGRLFAHILPKPVIPDVLLGLVQRYVRD